MRTCELRESKVARAIKSLSRIPLAIHSAVPDKTWEVGQDGCDQAAPRGSVLDRYGADNEDFVLVVMMTTTWSGLARLK
jgi:hypothetical protein